MGNLVLAARVGDIAHGEAMLVEAEGREIALFNLGGEYYALDNECTHVGGPLCEGDIDGETVVCPWHGAEFDVKTGKVLAPPAEEDVKSYRVIVDGDKIMVEL